MIDKSTQPKTSSFDRLKWGLIAVLIVAGIWANQHYSQVDWSLRLVGWILLACLVLVVALQTAIGQRLWGFAKDARIELRKVVWPTRPETIQTTVIVMCMVIVMALILWGLDSVLLWLVSLLTGRGA
jgi:preprotein translocase subunit SecE